MVESVYVKLHFPYNPMTLLLLSLSLIFVLLYSPSKQEAFVLLRPEVSSVSTLFIYISLSLSLSYSL